MKKKYRVLLLAVAVCLLIGLCFCGCGKSGGETKPSVGTEKVTYTVTLKTEGGKALEGVGVYFYTDATMAELVWFAKTDAAGAVSFTDLESNGYIAVLDNPPAGYKVEPYYPLTSQSVEIVLATDMADGDLETLRYQLGDVMMNFSVTDVDGKTWVLSDLLAEKQAVVLNFWYLQCAPCKAEFPYLQAAYEAYSDKIALIAMNPINDSREEIAAYAVENGLTFPMLHCDPAWEKTMQLTAYPTTVIIDRFGTIALIHKGSIDDSKVFEDAFAFFTAENYEQTTVENIKDLEIKATGSDSSNPIEIGSVTSFEVTLEPGQLKYYNIYRVDGWTLTVNNRDIYAIYQEQTREPNGGTLSFTVHCADTYTPASVVFGNSGEETETFTVRLTAKPGTEDNPFSLKLGDFAVKVAAGTEKGVFHVFTPQQDGILTVQCVSVDPAGTKYKIQVNTQNASGGTRQENLETDAAGETAVVKIPVLKGVKVQINIGPMPDDTNSYPAATFQCKLSIGDKTDEDEDASRLTYAVTITDQDAVPVGNVKMKIQKVAVQAKADAETDAETDTETDNAPADFNANEWGVAHATLDAGTYEVTIVTLPTGYGANTAKFKLTEDRPFATIKLDEIIVEIVSYTIVVKDTEGNPIPGATVIIGMEEKITDAEGKVVFEIQKNNYNVSVLPPDGSGLGIGSHELKKDDTLTEIVLKEDTSGEDPDVPGNKLDYSVTVVDYSGNPQSGVRVQIQKNGMTQKALVTDDTGRVQVQLEAGDYTVVLSGTSLYYEPKLAVLSEAKPDLTLKLAPAISGEPEEYWFGAIRYLQVGGNYATIQPNTVNYFVFEPTEAGLYKFSCPDPAAVLSYQGGSLYYVADMTSSTDYNPRTNSFTRNWKESNIGGIVMIGVTGAEDCIIEVTRIGDPILDETDLTVEVYQPKTKPTAAAGKIPAAQGRKLVYVDQSGKTSDYRIVLGSDGYYHLNSATGPKLYMNIGPNAPFHSLYHMAGAGGNGVAGTGIKATIYDDNGVAVKRVDFSECMLAYGECADPTYGVYPLTEDLVYIVQTAGEYYGWWDSGSSNFWLETVQNLNPELGWMFAVCYVP